MKLVAISGSLRVASLNRRLLDLSLRVLEKEGAQVDRVDLRAHER